LLNIVRFAIIFTSLLGLLCYSEYSSVKYCGEWVKILGDLSKKYESSGEPGTISTGYGDAGGVSYGAYQFSSNAGVVDNFVNWLENYNPLFYELLKKYPVGSLEFNNQWTYIAENYRELFFSLQHDYTKELYYDRARDNLFKIGIDIDTRSDAMRDVVWSRAVQYHPKWMPDLFKQAAQLAGQELVSMSDKDLIYYIYEVLLTDPDWTSGSPSLRPGLFNRFNKERNDALNML
jgi:hypothetical protein